MSLSGGVEGRGIRVMCFTWQPVLAWEGKWQSECWLLVKEKRQLARGPEHRQNRTPGIKVVVRGGLGECESKTQLGLR